LHGSEFRFDATPFLFLELADMWIVVDKVVWIRIFRGRHLCQEIVVINAFVVVVRELKKVIALLAAIQGLNMFDSRCFLW
jgi:hypothetical protein